MQPRYCTACGQPLGDSFSCRQCHQLVGAEVGVRMATRGQRLGALILDAVLPLPTLGIGYVVWWLIALGSGQTPGQQLVGIRAASRIGAPRNWPMTFVREVLVKGLLFGLVGLPTYGLLWLLDAAWVLADRDGRALHDKVARTIVIDDRRLGTLGLTRPAVPDEAGQGHVPRMGNAESKRVLAAASEQQSLAEALAKIQSWEDEGYEVARWKDVLLEFRQRLDRWEREGGPEPTMDLHDFDQR